MSTIYIHWPFCLSKCHYCDFNSVKYKRDTNLEEWFGYYKKILLKFHNEFYNNEEITSVYFGGGTPSLLPSWFIDKYLDTIRKNFKLSDNAEINIEANPKTLDKTKAIDYRKSGINRLSVGVQSIIDDDLKTLGRTHFANEAVNCVYEMSEIFENLSIDMIYNRPGQKIENWEKELNAVLKFPIKHISLYELIVEENTLIKKMIDSGTIPKQNTDSEFFENTIRISENNGFEMYEISNFAYTGGSAENNYQGKHNLSYWKYEDYYGIGPGSHSRITKDQRKIAICQILDNSNWIDWAKNPIFDEEILSYEDELNERLIMGLRSIFGIEIDKIKKNIKNKKSLENKIEKLTKNSYIIKKDGIISLTKEGMLKLNLIIKYLSGE